MRPGQLYTIGAARCYAAILFAYYGRRNADYMMIGVAIGMAWSGMLLMESATNPDNWTPQP